MLFKVTLKLDGHKINLIKLVRYVSTLGLREAKEFVELHLSATGDSVVIRVPNPAKVFEALTAFDSGRFNVQSPVWSDLVKIEPMAAPVPMLTTLE